MRVGLGSIAQLFLSILPVFLLIGLTRYRAFNFRFFMTRYALYATLFLLMIAMFAVLYLPLRVGPGEGYTVGLASSGAFCRRDDTDHARAPADPARMAVLKMGARLAPRAFAAAAPSSPDRADSLA